MCLGAISITAQRETAVDFAKPFKQKKFNLLMRKPEARTSIFQFLWPFSTSVWIMTLSAIVAVSILLYAVDRISPNGRRPDDRFGLATSLFYVYGTLVGPGTDAFPTRFSGQILSASWWFVGLILVSSYTANLAAFLTVTKIETDIKNVADLAEQRQVKYGTVKNTYAASMFGKSQLPLFQKMWQFMTVLNTDLMVDNTTEGIKRVRQVLAVSVPEWSNAQGSHTLRARCPEFNSRARQA
jgi:Ligand-gated ion channel/Bacterial extracellular solute-binding proteins, family 3